MAIELQEQANHILSWLRAGCPVPLNWWDAETAARHPSLAEPAPVDKLLEFGGSQVGLWALESLGGEEGHRAILAIDARVKVLTAAAREACRRLQSIGLSPVNFPDSCVHLQLQDPRDAQVMDGIDKLLASVDIKAKKHCFETFPLSDNIMSKGSGRRCMEVVIDLDDAGLI